MADLQEPFRYVKDLQGQLLVRNPALSSADGERTFQSGSGDFHEDISSQTYKTSIARIRASSNLNPNILYITPDGGNWEPDPDDETTPDNTGTVLVAADGLRLKRKYDGAIDIRWFGAIPDGVTPCSDAIQLAVNSLQSQKIVFPSGVYVLDKKITVSNNKQFVFGGNGKFEVANPGGASGPGNGITCFSYIGQDEGDDCAIEFEDLCRTDLLRFSLINDSGRDDVDGIKVATFTRSTMSEVTINGFRRCLEISGDFHYSQITHCRFRNAKEAAIYATGLANGTIFYACHFNIGEGKGFYGDGTGNPLTFIGCWFEHYEDYALELRNAVQTNLYGCYFEIGGSGIGDSTAATIRIHPNAFPNTAYTPTNVVFNGCHFGGDQRDQVYARGGDNPDPLHQTIDIKFENCNFTSSGFTTTDPTYALRTVNSGKISASFVGNKDRFVDPAMRYLRVSSPGALRSYRVSCDSLGESSDPATGLTVTDRMYSLHAQSLALLPSWTGNPVNMLARAGSPEGVIAASPGSIYIQTNATSIQGRLWVKNSGTGNTGWVTFQPNNSVTGGVYQDANYIDTTPGARHITFSNSSGSTGYPSEAGAGILVKRGDQSINSGSFKIWKSNTAGDHDLYIQLMEAGGVWGDFTPLLVGGSSELVGTDIDFRIAGSRYKSITSDLTLTTSSHVEGKPIDIQITNTDTNPHTVTITGVQFPNGADNEIPAGGRAHISLQQINGVMDASIVIYSPETT